MLRVLLSASVFVLVPFAPAAEPKPLEPFNGKSLDGWKPRDEKKSLWQVCAVAYDPTKPAQLVGGINNSPDGTGSVLATVTPSCDLFTADKFGDVTVEVEFMIPKDSNSGVYLMGEYEVQIIDSFGKADEKLGPGDMGGIYHTAAPKKNVCKKPGAWQKFVIEFEAPKFTGDKKTANAKFVKVTFNDVVIHENVEVKDSTGGGLTGKEHATGPLMFQGDHGPVAFRNIKITPKK